MNVLLLHLPMPRKTYLSLFSLPEPLTHLFLAPALKGRHEICFADLRVTPNLTRELGSFRPDAAVVGVNPLTYAALGKTLRDLRCINPSMKILLVSEAEYGNNHTVERPLDLVHPDADALVQPIYLNPICCTTRAALDAWENRTPLEHVPGLWIQKESNQWSLTAQVEDKIADVSAPDRKLLGRCRGKYRFGGIGDMAYLFYTYGCKFKCRFCPMSKYDGAFSTRNLNDVLVELHEMTEQNVYLQDYEPFQFPEAMHQLADAIEKMGIQKNYYMMTRADTALAERDLIARWQRIGLKWVYLGLDGHSAERLKEIRKGNTPEQNQQALRMLEKMGIGVSVGFLVRSDFTRQDFRDLGDYVAALRPRMVDFTVETPLVGTKLFDDVEAQLTTKDMSLFDLQHAVLPTRMPLKDFYAEMNKLHLLAGRISLPGMVRHMSARDLLRNWANGPRALWSVWRSASHHRGTPTLN